MKVLFLTIGRFSSIDMHSGYPDLLRCFKARGDQLYIVSASEKREDHDTEFYFDQNTHHLKVRIGNITKCGTIEKGISTLLIEKQYKAAIDTYFKNVVFDLVLYPTPPITLAGVVSYIKKRDHAKTYLLLKDIFPQNSVDIGMLSKNGWRGVIYSYFRRKEKELYAVSDRIGCMSAANVEYVLKNNPEIERERVEVCPNCIEPFQWMLSPEGKAAIRSKYGLPQNQTVFVYGGNLGRPQGISFLIDCLKTQERNGNAFFLIVGNGTEYSKLEAYFAEKKPMNMKLMSGLPKDEYDQMVAACDVGMVFLDHRFTIPNFPSRILNYMQAQIPVLACTDVHTDLGKVIIEGKFGWWCESNDCEAFSRLVRGLPDDYSAYGQRGLQVLKDQYSSETCYETIIESLSDR